MSQLNLLMAQLCCNSIAIFRTIAVPSLVVEEVIDVGCSAASSNKDEIDSDYLEMDDEYRYFESTPKPTPSRDSQKR